MLRIGVCEDQYVWQKYIKKKLGDYFLKKGEPYLLKIFSTGEDLLYAYDFPDIIFMDLDLPGLNGIDTAIRIRTIDNNVEIVFLTSHLEYMQLAFKVKAFRFLDKDFEFETLERTMDEYFKEKGKFINLEIETGGEKILVNTRNIIMIEATKNGSIIYCRTNEIFSRNSLSAWELILGNKYFARTHKSYLVHMFAIKKVEEKISLLNGYIAEISRRNKREFRRVYYRFLEENWR